MDELQLRMIALQSATRAVAAREEKENKEEELLEMEKENGMYVVWIKGYMDFEAWWIAAFRPVL